MLNACYAELGKAAGRGTGFGALYLLSNRLLHTTLTELSAMHAPATHGGNWKCSGG